MLKIPDVKYLSQSTPRHAGYTASDLLHLPSGPTRRALLAFQLCVRYGGLPFRVGARLAGASATYTRAVAHLSPRQRAQLISGTLKLGDAASGHRREGLQHVTANVVGEIHAIAKLQSLNVNSTQETLL